MNTKMLSMKRSVITLVVCCCYAISIAQTNTYVREGNQAFRSGQYQVAIHKYKAGLTLMENRRVSENSSEYLSVQKELARAERGLSLVNTAESAFKMGTENGYLRAKNTYRQVLALNNNDARARQRILDCDKHVNIIVQSRKDQLLWKETLLSNTRASYIEYLAQYAGGLFADQARNAVEKIDDNQLWAEVSSQGTQAAFERYLQDSKLGIHSTAAKHELDVIKDRQLWDNVASSQHIQDFRGYLEDSSNSIKHYRDSAEANIFLLTAIHHAQQNETRKAVEYFERASNIMKLNDEAKKLYIQAKEQEDYKMLKRSPSLTNVTEFLNAYPNSPQRTEISDLYSRLASETFTIDTREEEYKRVLAYATEKNTINVVERQYAAVARLRRVRDRKLWWRDRLQLGIGGDVELSEYTLGYSPKLHFKLGRYNDRINFSLGAHYINSRQNDLETFESTGDGIRITQLAFPALLRTNILSGRMFISGGASYNINLAASYESASAIDIYRDRKLVNAYSTTAYGQIGTGWRSGELSIYYKGDISPFYNRSYIFSQVYADSEVHNQISERWRIGVSLILYLMLTK